MPDCLILVRGLNWKEKRDCDFMMIDFKSIVLLLGLWGRPAIVSLRLCSKSMPLFDSKRYILTYELHSDRIQVSFLVTRGCNLISRGPFEWKSMATLCRRSPQASCAWHHSWINWSPLIWRRDTRQICALKPAALAKRNVYRNSQGILIILAQDSDCILW